ncbi:hypothetical protein CpecA_0065 [Chlamydia pecorum IPTaLE]|nr:hypothetical protein CpecA_0065 [Chlamydia pecorum IPTaLE]
MQEKIFEEVISLKNLVMQRYVAIVNTRFYLIRYALPAGFMMADRFSL